MNRREVELVALAGLYRCITEDDFTDMDEYEPA